MDPLTFHSTESSSDSDFEQRFLQKMAEFDEQHPGAIRTPWTRHKVFEVINHIKQAKEAMENGGRKTSGGYYWMSKCEVVTEGGEDHLIFKRKPNEDPLSPTPRIVPREEYFSVLKEVHESCRHGGRDKIQQIIKSQYYIPRTAIGLFVALCPNCKIKRIQHKKNIDYFFTGQFELIDFQSCPDGDYKWLLIYQDDGTKFLNLRPLTSIKTNEVAVELLKIFLTIGAPHVLKCNRGLVFTENVINELMKMWPECKIIQRSPHVEAVEQIKHYVENKLRLWMSVNKSTNWSLGCYFVQYQKNTEVNHLTGKTPFKSLFGTDPKTGLNAKPSSIVQTIETEEWPESQFNDNVPGQRSIEDDLSDSNIATENDSQTDTQKPEMIICKTEIVTEDNMPCDSSTSTRTAEIDYLEIKIEPEFDINETQGIKRPAETTEDIEAKHPNIAKSEPIEFRVPKLERPEDKNKLM